MENKERWIDSFLNYEFRIRKFAFKTVDVLFVIALWSLALLVRIKLFPIESADYYGFLESWMNQIKELGGFRSLGTPISNYTSPYMYLMCMVSGMDNSLYALKIISVVFDYLASIAVFMIAYYLTGNTRKSVLAMAILLLCPTTIIDSAYWCQCDIIYTCFILFSLYFFFKDKNRLSMLFFGISFAFKLQALFILPFYLIMWLKKRTVKLLDLIIVPVVYVVAQLPAWMFGRSFKELMTIYLDQSGYYPWGTLQYPNLYALLDETIDTNHHMYEISSAGTILTIILLGVLCYYIYSKKFVLTNEILVSLALFSVGIVVYTLPHMHDRYGFLIDLLAIIYCILRPKKLPITAGFMMVTTVTFMPYLIATSIFELKTVSVVLLALLIYVGYDLYKLINENLLTEPEAEPDAENVSEISGENGNETESAEELVK